MEYGLKHLKFCIELYNIQLSNGLYFLHEHPASARSWQVEEMKESWLNQGSEK